MDSEQCQGFEVEHNIGNAFMMLRYMFRVFRLLFSTCFQDNVRNLEMITQQYMHFLSLVKAILQLQVTQLLQSLYGARSILSRVGNQLFGMSDFPEYTFTAISLFLYIWMASYRCSISNIDASSH